MRCAIMQPTYLPWAGYFHLMQQVDCFVFLDDVQFERRSWQSRNRILLQGKEFVLTVPVMRADRSTAISEIKISHDTDWRKSHWQTLVGAYGKAAHGDAALALLEPFYHGAAPILLSEFNQAIVRGLAAALGVTAQFRRASEMGCGGSRSLHLIGICEALGCAEYVSPRGSMEYLHQDDFSSRTTTRLTFHEYTPDPYLQRHASEFVSHLSVVDVIANGGIEFARNYIR